MSTSIRRQPWMDVLYSTVLEYERVLYSTTTHIHHPPPIHHHHSIEHAQCEYGDYEIPGAPRLDLPLYVLAFPSQSESTAAPSRLCISFGSSATRPLDPHPQVQVHGH